MANKNSAEKSGVKGKLTTLLGVVFLAFALVFSGCSTNIVVPADEDDVNNTQGNLNLDSQMGNSEVVFGNSSGFQENNEFKKFNSKDDLIDYLNRMEMESSSLYSSGGTGAMIKTMSDSVMAETSVSFEGSANSAVRGSDSGAQDYSSTNNQVENVDESDIVKNDGKYIYTLSQNKLVIVEAFPAKEMKVVSTIKFDEEISPRNLFINGDKLVVFTNEYEKVEKVSDYNFVPYETSKGFTHIYIYDISDKKDVVELRDFSVSGDFDDARMIGDDVYVISKEYVNFYRGLGSDIDVPMLYSGSKRIASPEIYYFDMPFNSYNYHTVSSFNLESLEVVDTKTFMLGYSNTLYVSENNIYISYPKNYGFNSYRFDAFNEVVLPLLPEEIKEKIMLLSNTEKYVVVLEDYYNTLDEKTKKDLINKINKGMVEYEKKIELDNSKTFIHKIGINEGKIEYDTKGEVEGHLLNQFSLDEMNGNLRVATTTSMWLRDDGRVSYSNVFVLDEEMEVIGELTKLAEDESIYSTRFMGDKLYMVTFKQVDPLFVIDLSDVTNPTVLGELKIPGFSNYLHPFDENHLIGIGKDTKESEFGGIVTTGVKLSLFDVSDFENPKEVDNYVIEGRWTDSPALHDHKAFLFDKEKELLVLPVREFIGDEKDYRRYEFEQAAHIFTITTQGFELRGKVTHEEKEESEGSWWYDSPSSVKRSLFMDDVLYTISDKEIKANDIVSIDAISEVDLGYKKPKYQYGYEIYY